MIAIIDYGMGNIHSVKKALEVYGARTLVAGSAKEVKSADKLVLPGVGAFDDAMEALEKQGLVEAINKHIADKKIFLGICLGMQLLFEKSEEAKKKSGLGIIKGEVKKFSPSPALKVPQMGWNQLKIIKKDCPLIINVDQSAFVYFCHSYYPDPKDRSVAVADCDYGREFACIIQKDNIYGVQFHPEKSQSVGLLMIRNFVEM